MRISDPRCQRHLHQDSRSYDTVRKAVIAVALVVASSYAHGQSLEFKQYWNNVRGSNFYFPSYDLAEADMKAAHERNQFLKRRTHGSIIEKNGVILARRER